MPTKQASTEVKLRRSAAIVAWPRTRSWEVRNFVLGSTTRCSESVIRVIGRHEHAVPARRILRELERLGVREPATLLVGLIRTGVLVATGSALDARERRWARTWRWGPLCAAHHRSLRDLSFASPGEAKRLLMVRARRHPPPPAIPEMDGARLALPAPRSSHGILAQLARRESVRELSGEALTRHELADVLYAGLGFRTLVDNVVHGTLPLKLTPSGGACNPIDGYVCVYAVEGLPPGAYRYSGLRRDLTAASRFEPPPARLLLGGQPWADGAAAVVFLLASFQRAWWKYEHALSYRMVTLEAGHIAQNMLVAASCFGLAAWPSGAVADTAVERLLGVDGPEHAVLYAIVLGRRQNVRQRSAADVWSSSRRRGRSSSASASR